MKVVSATEKNKEGTGGEEGAVLNRKVRQCLAEKVTLR